MKRLLLTIVSSCFLLSCGTEKKEDNQFENDTWYKSYEPSFMSVYDEDAEIIEGRESQEKDFTIYDLDGNYIYGHKDEYGNITMHDLNGNYMYGTEDELGNISVYDLEGNYMHGYSDGMGGITMYGSEGDIDIINYSEW